MEGCWEMGALVVEQLVDWIGRPRLEAWGVPIWWTSVVRWVSRCAVVVSVAVLCWELLPPALRSWSSWFLYLFVVGD